MSSCLSACFAYQRIVSSLLFLRFNKNMLLIRYLVKIRSKYQNTKYFTRNVSSDDVQCKTLLTMQDIPQPKSLPIIGTNLSLMMAGGGKRLHEYIDRRHRDLGSIFCEKLGGANLIFINDPDLMKSLFINLEGKYPLHILPEPWVLYEKLYGSKRGLFFMNGEEWLGNRRIMNKHLLREGADDWLKDSVTDTVAMFVRNWQKNAEKQNFIPKLESDFYKLSTNVIIAVLLGQNSSISTGKYYEEMLSIFSETVKKIFFTTTKLYGMPVHLCQKMNLKLWRDFKESVDESLYLAQKIVNEMLKNKAESNGLISKLCNEGMSDATISRIVADFIIAAGDTTAYTTLWILLLLSNNGKVVSEARTKNEAYIKCILKESMRLFPVAPFLTRILPMENFLGDYRIGAGTPIIASIYTSGRDENNFTNAAEFLPHRWDRSDPRKQELANHVPSASLPFALGSRSCIGKKIAMVQLTEITKQILENFDLKCLNSQSVNAVTCGILVPDQQIKLLITPRKS